MSYQKFIDPHTGRTLGILRAPMTLEAMNVISRHGVGMAIQAFDSFTYKEQPASIATRFQISLEDCHLLIDAGLQILEKVCPSLKPRMQHKVTLTFENKQSATNVKRIMDLAIKAGGIGIEPLRLLAQELTMLKGTEMISEGTLGELQKEGKI